ncbi:MAG: RNA 3'-terminal phosphate cyclase [Fimbriimonas sp.]|nr:RNA 3'-terminal phosphate cyclase [Fimbriimonas sp.]
MRGESQAVLVIDGNHGEGAGALVRTCLVMSTLTQQGVRIQNVRGASKFPGLDVEDLTLLRALAVVCRAETVGAEVGSDVLTFLPTARPSGYQGDILSLRNEMNRGANALVVLGSLLPPLARSGVYSSLNVDGETYGNNAISYDYFTNVTLAAFRKIGLYAFPRMVTAGFGRESRGLLSIDVEPSALKGIEWTDRGSLESVSAVVATSSIPSSVGERIVAHLRTLAQNTGLPMVARHVEVEARGPGAFVTTWAQYQRGIGGGTAMGARGIRGETLAQLAFEELFDWMSGAATTDPYLADQVLLPLVLAESPSTFTVSRLTQRFLTIVWVIKQFTPIHLTVRGTENGPGTVRIERS